MVPRKVAFAIVELAGQITRVANVYQQITFSFSVFSTLAFSQSPKLFPGGFHAMDDCYIFARSQRGFVERVVQEDLSESVILRRNTFLALLFVGSRQDRIGEQVQGYSRDLL